jgi:hypothetical protein
MILSICKETFQQKLINSKNIYAYFKRNSAPFIVGLHINILCHIQILPVLIQVRPIQLEEQE